MACIFGNARAGVARGSSVAATEPPISRGSLVLQVNFSGFGVVSRFRRGLMAGSAVVGASLALPVATAPVLAQPVVQALPNPNTERLSDALTRLGRDPRNLDALLDAGDAARGLGDFEAATGFYRRADAISPGNARVASGLAMASLMNGDPIAAIDYFSKAEKAGAGPSTIAKERGLAYDLVGDNVTAQRYYAQAMGGTDEGEVRQRLAISQAIAGNQAAAEQTLMPLLRKQDKPGWRARAFTLAIAGDTKQAVDVANTILPPTLAENIAPYLRYMPRLTHAQQAAAANLGRFPRASEIGRDDPRIAAYAPSHLASADAGLIPQGAPLGGGKTAKSASSAKSAKVTTLAKADAASAERKTQSRSRTALQNRTEVGGGYAEPASTARVASSVAQPSAPAKAQEERVAPPEPKPAIERSDVQSAQLDANGELPAVSTGQAVARPVVQARPSAAVASKPAPTPQPVAKPSTSPVTSTPATRTAVAGPGFDLAAMSSSHPATATTAAPAATASTPPAPVSTAAAVERAAPEPTETAPPPQSLAEVFADFEKPSLKVAPASGSVDIRTIEPARPAPKPKDEVKPKEEVKPKKPAPPAHPSRMWVQIGIGRDKAAIAYDWKRYIRSSPDLFKNRKPYTAEMGRTNRILIGPFDTKKAADQFLADAKKAGVDGAYPWTSPAGQVVDPLPVK